MRRSVKVVIESVDVSKMPPEFTGCLTSFPLLTTKNIDKIRTSENCLEVQGLVAQPFPILSYKGQNSVVELRLCMSKVIGSTSLRNTSLKFWRVRDNRTD